MKIKFIDDIVYLINTFIRCQLVPPEASVETYEKMSPLEFGVSKISIIAGTFEIKRSAGETKSLQRL